MSLWAVTIYLTCCVCGVIQPTRWLCSWNVTLFITPIYCACDSCRADCHCTHDADDAYFFLCAMLKQPAHNEMVIFPAACSRAVSHLHICSGWMLWVEYKMWTTGDPDYKLQWGKGTTDLIPEQMGTTTVLQIPQLPAIQTLWVPGYNSPNLKPWLSAFSI